MSEPEGAPDIAPQFELALASDIGSDRPNNEDSFGHLVERHDAAMFAVADGVGGYEGGEIASRMAIEVTLQCYRENPREWGAAKRLARAVQAANIEIHHRTLIVPELRRMATTLTAAAIEGGTLHAAHVGDCRLYLVRDRRIAQLSKDHTVAGERVRMGLMSEARARNDPERSALMRSLGRELIVSVDRISIPLRRGDQIIVCSDGLYNVLEDDDLMKLTREREAEAACRALIDEANRRGTADNLTVAFFRMLAETPDPEPAEGLRAKLRRFLSRGR